MRAPGGTRPAAHTSVSDRSRACAPRFGRGGQAKRGGPGKTPVDLKEWVDTDRLDMAEYLRQPCPASFRQGRRLKYRFRSGCNILQGSISRRCRESRTRNQRCPCCSLGVHETVEHALFECPQHKELREVFLSLCAQKYPPFILLDQKERLLLLMADDTPVVLSWLLYRYLMRISASRESRLGNLAAQGEGS